MSELGLDPREGVVLRMVAAEPGRSQRSLTQALQVRASHLVGVIDGLEDRGLLERRPNPRDRRAHALHLTRRGKSMLGRLMDVSAVHESDLTGSLTAEERRTLEKLLTRVAQGLGHAEGGHPGFDESE
jgi:DNA-binding MarR family transcriptional regulator